MTFSEKFKENWERVVTIVALTFGTIVSFERNLVEISLERRFLIVGLAGALATVWFAKILRPERTQLSVGFGLPKKTNQRSLGWFAIRAVFILAMAAMSVFLLRETITFHNVRVTRTTPPGNPSVGIIEIQPAHTPTALTVNLSTSQADQIKILFKAPASWNNEDPVDWGMQDDTPFGVTLNLRDFQSPQVFGIWYKLSGRAEELEVEARGNPAEVRVLRDEQLHKYRRNIWIFGGMLCAIALSFFFYRSS
jgi:hypothetical protein